MMRPHFASAGGGGGPDLIRREGSGTRKGINEDLGGHGKRDSAGAEGGRVDRRGGEYEGDEV